MAKTPPKKKNRKNVKKIVWSIVGLITVLVLVLGFFFYQYIVDGLPSLEELENPDQSLASNVFSIDGELIGQFYRENRIEVNIDSLPPYVINALVATEDRKFYKHWGVDLDRFAKAMVKNVLFFDREGASTITQQLAKNLYELKYGNESLFDTGVRKIREWITAVQIERTYTKKEILEMYYNESYFGNSAYGIEMAAHTYFDKDAKDLDLEEAAVLVALLKSSVYYNPVKRYNSALARRNLVMKNMVDAGYLEKAEYDSLKMTPIKLSQEKMNRGFRSSIAPHFVEYVRQQLEDMADKYDFDLYEDGLTIYTSLDTRMQNYALKAMNEHLDEFQKQFDKRWNWSRHRHILNDHLDKAIKNRRDYKNAANRKEKNEIYSRLKNNVVFVDSVQRVAQTIEVGFTALDVKTGEIRAMIGGRNPEQGRGLNHVTQIRRQPGSSFKPIVYTTAINNGLYPAYPMLNARFEYPAGDGKIWSPQNFERTTSGYMTLREGLTNSKNIIAGRLVIENHVSLNQIGQIAQKMGIKTKLNLVPAIALGASEVQPLELVSAYETLANRGIHVEPISILRIEDKDGIVIDNFFSDAYEAIDEEVAYIVTDMMESVIKEGTGMRVWSIHGFKRPCAGKTGTTSDYADAWFVGFTPQIAAGTWVGFDDRRITFTGSYGQGSKAAAPIWAEFMRMTYDSLDFPLAEFTKPANGNIVTATFCKESIYELGDPKLYSPDCNSGKLRDIIQIDRLPDRFNARRDTSVHLFTKYMVPDSSGHLAREITD